jgi:hypothetical protein
MTKAITILIIFSAFLAFGLKVESARTISSDGPEAQSPRPVAGVLGDLCSLDVVECAGRAEYRTITAYNTVPGQTDDTPCLSANGQNICGRSDVVACPRAWLGKKGVEIAGKKYQCLDVLAERFDNRIDISFDKDIAGARQWGIKRLKVYIFDL